jgi:hypothetical protein
MASENENEQDYNDAVNEQFAKELRVLAETADRLDRPFAAKHFRLLADLFSPPSSPSASQPSSVSSGEKSRPSEPQ